MQITVCSEAPNFRAAAVMANGEIREEFQLSDYRGKYVVLFFYPLDFTFVCPVSYTHLTLPTNSRV